MIFMVGCQHAGGRPTSFPHAGGGVQDGHPVARLGQAPGAGQADDPATDDRQSGHQRKNRLNSLLVNKVRTKFMTSTIMLPWTTARVQDSPTPVAPPRV